jgi:DNA primase
MLAEKVPFPEAVEIVAEKCGIPIPAAKGFDDQKSEERKQLFEINERAAAYFEQMLSSEEAGPAKQVIEKRRVGEVFAKKFGLGYAPGAGLMAHLRLKDPVASGLFVKNDRGEVYDRFRRRLMFPIWNERGKVIGFGGRALMPDAQPKYLNSPESPLYSKSHVLYALHFARDAAQKAGRLVVVEGYFDCLSLHQAGITNVVASCGTALTQQQVGLMARYVPEVVMNYDPDAAGQNAMRRSIDLLLAKALRVRILKLEGGLDPDDYVRKEGGEVYAKLLANAPYFWQYLMTEAAQQNDLDQPAMKANAVNDVMQYVGKIQDKVEQIEVARAVAEGFKIPESALFERLKIAPRRPEVRPMVRTAAPPEPVRRLKQSEKQLIHALLQGLELTSVLEPFLSEQFTGEFWARPVLEGLLKDPARNIENALANVQDEELRNQVRAAASESFGPISMNEAVSCLEQLYQNHLVQKLEELDATLKQYSSGPAPLELIKRKMDLVAERSRISSFRNS